MGQVTVFVDDAVLGRLPDVCAKDGVVSTDRLSVEREIGRTGRLGVLWLLVFFGPIGWIALFVLASLDRGERLSVQLPYSDGAYQRVVSARRLRTGALVGGLSGAIALAVLSAWAGLGPTGALLAFSAAIVAVVLTMVGEWRIGRHSVTVDLDASRRWVTLRGVHPDFVAACLADSPRRARV